MIVDGKMSENAEVEGFLEQNLADCVDSEHTEFIF